MRWLGMILLLISAAEAGCFAANGLRRRAERIRILERLLAEMMSELKCKLPLVSDLLCTLAAEDAFQSLRFLQFAAHRAAEFPACWANGVEEDSDLTEGERAVLRTVGETLGSTALDGQLAVLELCAERLRAMHSEYEQYFRQRGKLYQSLGILGGIFLVIILI